MSKILFRKVLFTKAQQNEVEVRMSKNIYIKKKYVKNICV